MHCFETGKLMNARLLGYIVTMPKIPTASPPSQTTDTNTQPTAGKILRLHVLFFE